MKYSNFAMHCPKSAEICEPVDKARQPDGTIKATYRSKDGHTWQQIFTVSHEAPLIDEPEDKQEKALPEPPKGDVMTWDQGEKNQFIESYGLEAYKSLVARHFKDGHAEYQAPETQSDMPTDHEVRNWTPKQRDNFVKKYGRDTYQQRMANAFKNDKEPVN